MRQHPTATSAREGYAVAMRAMHWATSALLIGSYLTAWVISDATKSVEVADVTRVHRLFGLIILTLTAVRLIWRQRTRMPPLPSDMPRLQQLAAKLNVIGLYALLLVQPLLGLTASMLHGDSMILLGGIVVPGGLPIDRPLAHILFSVHGGVASVLLGLIGVHAAAALYHHFVLRDDVLVGMLPRSARALRTDVSGA
jgi:superoxide oxidase